MNQLPIFLSLSGQPVLIVGGTDAAGAKLRLVEQAGGAPRVVTDAGRLAEADFAGVRLAYVATGDAALDATVSHQLQAAGLLVNVVDRPALSNFTTPAIVDRDPVVIAIGSNGTAPVLARRVRATIDRLLPARLGAVARLADSFRAAVAARLPDIGERRRFWDAFFAGEAARAMLAGDESAARSATIEALNRAGERGKAKTGEVYLVGAGPGDPELLTLKAHRLLLTADAIVYDELGAAPVVELARRDAERHFVGKRKGRHSAGQEDINALLVRLALQGKTVVRLKGGDPLVFGRAAEEIAALRAAGVAVSVVPGVTAALAGAAAAGVSLTNRDHAQALTLVTAHRKAGEAPTDFGGLAGKNQTLAVYMGLSRAGEIAAQLVADGWAEATPVVVVVDAGRPDQVVRRGPLAQLGALTADLVGKGAGMLLIGDAVGAEPALSVASQPPGLLAEADATAELYRLSEFASRRVVS